MGLFDRFAADWRVSRRMPPIRALNTAARWAERLGISAAPDSAAALISSACRATDLLDFGPMQPQEPLEVLLDALRREGCLHAMGWLTMRYSLHQTLCAQLRIQEEIRQFPAILAEPIEAPIFIVSLPRTGTTLLHRLLATDPGSRAPLCWETRYPTPHPRPETHRDDPRVARTRRDLDIMHRFWPMGPSLHPMAAEEAEECNMLLERSLHSPQFSAFCGLESYGAWLRERDLTAAYRYHRLQLQILQYRFEKHRWILKSPLHMPSLDALLAVYPDATIVQTHRDPLKLIPSACSLVATVRGWGSDAFPPERIGAEAVAVVDDWLRRSNEVRAASDPSRFVDLQFGDLVRAPIATIRELYERLGLETTDAFDAAMKRWLAANPRDKHGVHRYSLEQFGLEAEPLRERFADYIAQLP